MKRCDTSKLFLVTIVLWMTFVTVAGATPSSASSARALSTSIKVSCANRLSGGEVSECKVGVVEPHENEIIIKVTSSNPGLLQPGVNEVRLSPKQEFARVVVTTSPTAIKTTINITASLAENNQVQAQESIELVPALIKSVNLSVPSIVGTRGAKATCQIQLKAPAPTGGIQIYLSPVKASPAPTNKNAKD